MIRFNDRKLFVKGTCNVWCTDIDTGDVVYQSNKMSTGSINPSTTMGEVRSGIGNAVTAFIPTDSKIDVEFKAADFQMWAKAAQVGSTITYSAPSPECQIVTANNEYLTIDVSNGVPSPEVGDTVARAYVQEVGVSSFIAEDGEAYSISEDGLVRGFTARPGTSYKVWYFVKKAAAKKTAIKSFIKPKIVRFNAQIAVYTNDSNGRTAKGTRIGWFYYTIPYLQLQGNAEINADQTVNDESVISGTALSYDPAEAHKNYQGQSQPALGYMIYAPDSDADEIKGIVVVGGTMSLREGESVQIPALFVMRDGSVEKPASYRDFDYEIADGGEDIISIDDEGIITGLGKGETEVTIYYVDDNLNVLQCVVNISVDDNGESSPVVGIGLVGYMQVA